MTKKECKDCKPKGSFVFSDGNTYPTYMALCDRCSEISAAYQAGRQYEYDKMHGNGAFEDMYSEGMGN